jgi:calcyclin binding protein
MSADELRQDLEELRRLEGLAKRPRVQSLLANEIHNVDAKVSLGAYSFYSFLACSSSIPLGDGDHSNPFGFVPPAVMADRADGLWILMWQLAKATAPAPAPASQAVAPAPTAVVAAAGRSYVTLGSFSWDQDSEKIRVWCC